MPSCWRTRLRGPSVGSRTIFQMSATMIPETMSGTISSVRTTAAPRPRRFTTRASPMPSTSSTPTAATVNTIVFQSAMWKRSLLASST